MKKAIVLANGKPPKKRVIEKLRKFGYDYFICADGGANEARRLGIFPDLIIGDFDSAKPEVLKYFSGKSKIIHLKRQNDTDVEKALKYAIRKGFGEVLLLGATGDRLDHSFCNLGIVLKFFKKIKVKIIHENSFLIPVAGKTILRTEPGEIISVFGFDGKTKFASKHLKYPLKNIPLKFGVRESASNVALKETIEIKVSGGVGFLVRDLQKAIEYDGI